MITINGSTPDAQSLAAGFPVNSAERQILAQMAADRSAHTYPSADALLFEVRMRAEIVRAALALYKSGMDFAVFRKSRCNPAFWERTDEGGFALREGVRPSDAIADIFRNGSRYATECATAIIIVYYGALLNLLGPERFDRLFPDIHLMNWHYIDRNLREIGMMQRHDDYLPGDRRYFSNPDVDSLTPEWQGENVIDLGNGAFYGHGLGIHTADEIIRALNQNRAPGATRSAYLRDSAGRPDFDRFARLAAATG